MQQFIATATTDIWHLAAAALVIYLALGLALLLCIVHLMWKRRAEYGNTRFSRFLMLSAMITVLIILWPLFLAVAIQALYTRAKLAFKTSVGKVEAEIEDEVKL